MHACIWPVEEGNPHNKQVQAVVLKFSAFKTNIDLFRSFGSVSLELRSVSRDSLLAKHSDQDTES